MAPQPKKPEVILMWAIGSGLTRGGDCLDRRL